MKTKIPLGYSSRKQSELLMLNVLPRSTLRVHTTDDKMLVTRGYTRTDCAFQWTTDIKGVLFWNFSREEPKNILLRHHGKTRRAARTR